jgi:Domain of unknown function (DUF4388)
VSLKGSLETIALPEVLHLLADTGKSGELRVSGTRDGGQLWFDAGLLSGFNVGSSPDPADALFQLLRVDTGEFSFDTDASIDESARTPDGGAQDVRPALDTAQARMAEWVDIVSVVPSLEHQVKLVDESPRDEVVVDRFQWSLLVAVGEGHPVQHVLDVRGLPEFDGCKALKGLVDASLVEVSEPVSQEAPALDEIAAGHDNDADDSAVTDSDVLAVTDADDSAVTDADDSAVTDADDSAVEDPVVEEEVPDYGYEPALDALDSTEEVVEEHAPEEPSVEAYAVPAVEPVDDPAPYVEAHGFNGAAEASEVGAVDGDAPAEVRDEPASDGREAMRALLAELSPKFEEPVAAAVSEPVDGLMDRGPWTPSELEQMSGWRREDGRDLIAWPDDEKASDPVAARVQDPASTVAADPSYTPNDEADAGVSAEATSADGYQLADFGFPLRNQASHENGQTDPHEAPASAHAEADAQGGHGVEPEEEPELEPAEEPMNRGLLLKFLSSVRN